MSKTKLGIVGCGCISGIYLKNLTELFGNTEVIASADLIIERAEDAAEKYNFKVCQNNDELYNDPDVAIVVNLTTPQSHFEVCYNALSAGKHVHVEKPLSISFEDGKKIIALAKEKNLRVGCAPDTFLGGGIQTCRKLIDEGAIGTPVAATAFMLCHGHESWHPDPEFYYYKGGGPMFDMGPYYLTALFSLLGPARRIAGSAKITFPQRTITSEKKYGTVIDVEVPTHINGIIDFECGVTATLITSFDIWGSTLPPIEIYGSEGSIRVPDPNSFGGPVYLKIGRDGEWQDIPIEHDYTDNSRGLGVADMAQAINENRLHRANGNMGLHVLEAMQGFHTSSDSGKFYDMTTTFERPEPFRTDNKF